MQLLRDIVMWWGGRGRQWPYSIKLYKVKTPAHCTSETLNHSGVNDASFLRVGVCWQGCGGARTATRHSYLGNSRSNYNKIYTLWFSSYALYIHTYTCTLAIQNKGKLCKYFNRLLYLFFYISNESLYDMKWLLRIIYAMWCKHRINL